MAVTETGYAQGGIIRRAKRARFRKPRPPKFSKPKQQQQKQPQDQDQQDPTLQNRPQQQFEEDAGPPDMGPNVGGGLPTPQGAPDEEDVAPTGYRRGGWVRKHYRKGGVVKGSVEEPDEPDDDGDESDTDREIAQRNKFQEGGQVPVWMGSDMGGDPQTDLYNEYQNLRRQRARDQQWAAEDAKRGQPTSRPPILPALASDPSQSWRLGYQAGGMVRPPMARPGAIAPVGRAGLTPNASPAAAPQRPGVAPPTGYAAGFRRGGPVRGYQDGGVAVPLQDFALNADPYINEFNRRQEADFYERSTGDTPGKYQRGGMVRGYQDGGDVDPTGGRSDDDYKKNRQSMRSTYSQTDPTTGETKDIPIRTQLYDPTSGRVRGDSPDFSYPSLVRNTRDDIGPYMQGWDARNPPHYVGPQGELRTGPNTAVGPNAYVPRDASGNVRPSQYGRDVNPVTGGIDEDALIRAGIVPYLTKENRPTFDTATGGGTSTTAAQPAAAPQVDPMLQEPEWMRQQRAFDDQVWLQQLKNRQQPTGRSIADEDAQEVANRQAHRQRYLTNRQLYGYQNGGMVRGYAQGDEVQPNDPYGQNVDTSVDTAPEQRRRTDEKPFLNQAIDWLREKAGLNAPSTSDSAATQEARDRYPEKQGDPYGQFTEKSDVVQPTEYGRMPNPEDQDKLPGNTGWAQIAGRVITAPFRGTASHLTALAPGDFDPYTGPTTSERLAGWKQSAIDYLNGNKEMLDDDLRARIHANPRDDHNEAVQQSFDAYQRRGDIEGAARLLHGLKEPYNYLRTFAQVAADRGDVDNAVKYTNLMHNLLPNNRKMDVVRANDGSFNVTVGPEAGGGGLPRQWNLTPREYNDFIHTNGSDFDHVSDNGTERNLDILTGGRFAPQQIQQALGAHVPVTDPVSGRHLTDPAGNAAYISATDRYRTTNETGLDVEQQSAGVEQQMAKQGYSADQYRNLMARANQAGLTPNQAWDMEQRGQKIEQTGARQYTESNQPQGQYRYTTSPANETVQERQDRLRATYPPAQRQGAPAPQDTGTPIERARNQLAGSTTEAVLEGVRRAQEAEGGGQQVAQAGPAVQEQGPTAEQQVRAMQRPAAISPQDAAAFRQMQQAQPSDLQSQARTAQFEQRAAPGFEPRRALAQAQQNRQVAANLAQRSKILDDYNRRLEETKPRNVYPDINEPRRAPRTETEWAEQQRQAQSQEVSKGGAKSSSSSESARTPHTTLVPGAEAIVQRNPTAERQELERQQRAIRDLPPNPALHPLWHTDITRPLDPSVYPTLYPQQAQAATAPAAAPVTAPAAVPAAAPQQAPGLQPGRTREDWNRVLAPGGGTQAQQQLPVVRTEADVKRLPPNTRFIGPDGRVGITPNG